MGSDIHEAIRLCSGSIWTIPCYAGVHQPEDSGRLRPVVAIPLGRPLVISKPLLLAQVDLYPGPGVVAPVNAYDVGLRADVRYEGAFTR